MTGRHSFRFRGQHALLSRFSLIPLLLCGASLAGCSGSAVREDRFIAVDPGGDSLSFQHGTSGVFVEQPGVFKNIFKPGPECVAVSSPRYSSDGKSLIFCVARLRKPDQDNTSSQAETDSESSDDPIVESDIGQTTPDTWDESPDGRRFFPAPITYTVMHYVLDEHSSEETPPKELFTADVDHSGYVAGNMAVAWYSNDEKILFVDKDSDASVSLFEFDLNSRTKAATELPPAIAAVPIVSPDGQGVVCLTTNDQRSVALWQRNASDGQWEKLNFYTSQVDDLDISGLATIQKLQPTWSPDGSHFLVQSLHSVDGEENLQSKLWLVDREDHESPSLLTESQTSITHLRWHPQNSSLGYCTDGSLHCIDPITTEELWSIDDVRAFAGWSKDGKSIAFTRGWKPTNGRFCTLIRPQPLQRDSLMVAEYTDGKVAEAQISEEFTGLRLAFPSWGKSEDEVLFWGTFTPAYQGVLSRLTTAGMPFGDPAARLDLSKNPEARITWMPIDSRETVQIGHYYLSINENETAWQWYEKAEKSDAESASAETPESDKPLNRSYDLPHLHKSICLRRLGRTAEADQALENFETSYLQWARRLAVLTGQAGATDQDGEQPQGDNSDSSISSDPATFDSLILPYLKTNYEAEVFLSLNAGRELEQVLDQRIASESGDAILAAQLARSQVMLVNGESEYVYAKWVIENLFKPLDQFSDFGDTNLDEAASVQVEQFRRILAAHAITLTLRPLLAGEFFAELSDEELEQIIEQLQSYRENSPSVLSTEFARRSLEVVQRSMTSRNLDFTEETIDMPIDSTTSGYLDQLLSVASMLSDEADWLQ